MIAGETAVLLAESGAFDRAREAVDQALAAYAEEPRYEQISNCLREVARIQANQEGAHGLAQALTFLDDAARVAEEARAAGFTASGRSLDSALAYEHGRVNAYAGEFEDSLAALERALALLGEPGPDTGAEHAGEWAECVRLAGLVEGGYLERRDPALDRIDAAVDLLRAAGREDAASDLTSLAGRLRSE
jgi:tetratricopeptide (TPR) repeat protein